MTIQSITQNTEILPYSLPESGNPQAERAGSAVDVAEISTEATVAQEMETIGSADGLPGEGAAFSQELGLCRDCGIGHSQTTVSGLNQDEESPESEQIEINGTKIPDLHELAFGEAEGEAESAAAAVLGDGEEEDAAVEDPAEQSITGEALTDEEQEEVQQLQERDREVRAHEQAHVAAGGSHVRGGIKYEYQTGPDGRRYAVGGEVSIDTSPVSGDPQKTIQKAQQIRRAALAPSEPSGADRQAAAAAARMEAEARQKLIEERTDAPETEGVTEVPSVGGGETASSNDSDSSTSSDSKDVEANLPGERAQKSEDASSEPGEARSSEGGISQPEIPSIEAPSIEAPEIEPPSVEPESNPDSLSDFVEEIQEKADDAAPAPPEALSP